MSQAAPHGDTRRDRHGVLLALVGVVVLVGALYVAGYFLLGNRVPTGIEVAGVDIGRMTPQDAEDTLRRELSPRADDPFRLTHDTATYRLTPKRAGLSLDVEQTVAEAGGGRRTWDPRQMLQVLVGSVDVDPVVNVDSARLGSALDSLRGKVEIDPVEPAIAFTASGSARVDRSQDGVTVDKAALRDALLAGYLREKEPIELPTRTVPPQVGPGEVRRALANFARPAVSAPVTLVMPGPDVRLPVSTYAPALRLQVVNGELTPVMNPDRLEPRLRAVMNSVSAQPRDAAVVLRGGRPVVVPDRSGKRLDPVEVARAVVPVLTERGRGRQARVSTITAKPDFSTAEARALRIREPVSSFVTYYPHSHYRNVNQGRAAELISGTVLKPGDTFSFNDTVGQRTRANGFIKGFVISDGVLARDLGGGVSQVVTTTFNAAFFAGLKDVEHQPHSYYISRYPVGREATVVWGSVDLKFQNTTPYGVLIEAWVVPSTPSREGEMHVRMWSTKYWDIRAGASERYNITSPGTRTDFSNKCVPQTGVPGFEIDVYRFFRKVGSPRLVRRETMHTTYSPADTVRCIG